MKLSLTQVSGFLFCLILSACAVIGAGPTGGKKDIIPPKVLKEVPENRSTNFTSDKIVISFDEFIDLGNVFQEVIISPTLKKMPTIQVQRKNLVVNFKGLDLKPNTTYSIQFGKAIKDYNEGNILRNYRYVFSTGKYLDSLSITGRGIEALSHKPTIGDKVELYSAGEDSGIYKEKPLYYTRCDSSGKFKIDYLPKGEYQLYILDDKNDNYFVDEGEDVGFPGSIIHLDTAIHLKDSISIFPYEPDQVTIKRIQWVNHLLQIKFDHGIDTLSLSENGKVFDARYKEMSEARDSFTCWTNKDLKNIEVKVVNNGFKSDTILKSSTGEDAKPVKFSVKFVSDIESSNYYGTPAVIVANKPIANINFALVKFNQDTTVLKGLSFHFLDSSHTSAGLFYNYEADKGYKFKFSPGAITSIFGEATGKHDTLSGSIVPPGLKNYGYFEINIVPDLSDYIFQMIDDKGIVIFYKNVPRETLVKVPFVNPGKYRVRLVKDENKNGRWDGGNLKTKRQPEEVIYYPNVIDMKANWEMTGMKFDLNSKSFKKP